MRTNLLITKELREELLSVSTSGRNEAAQSFMGRVRDMITAKLLPSANDVAGLSNTLIDESWSESPEDGKSEWTMIQYKSNVETLRAENPDGGQTWDDLEKSIIAKIADEVKIGMKGSEVEITVFKSFTDESNA